MSYWTVCDFCGCDMPDPGEGHRCICNDCVREAMGVDDEPDEGVEIYDDINLGSEV